MTTAVRTRPLPMNCRDHPRLRELNVGRSVADSAAPVLAALLGAPAAEAVLRAGFAEAQRRDVALEVVIAGSAATASHDPFLVDLVERWAGKFPAVPVVTSVRRGIDAAIILAGATRHCGTAVVPGPADARTAAVLNALARRTHCPLIVVDVSGVDSGGHSRSTSAARV